MADYTPEQKEATADQLVDLMAEPDGPRQFRSHVRFNDAEWDFIQSEAQRQDCTPADFIRRSAVACARAWAEARR